MNTSTIESGAPRPELIPHLVDSYATTTPDAIYAEYPVSPVSYDDGYRPVTYRSFANAVNGVAWWLTQTLGPGRGEILAYIGPHDVRYPALVLGAVKTGYCLFLSSPRNSLAAHESLFRRLDCTKILAPSPCPAAVTAIREAIQMDLYEVPSIEDLLDTEHRRFEFSKTYPKHAQEKLAIVHTSGSTGIPKPIVFTHDAAVRHMRMTSLAPPDGFNAQSALVNGKREFLPLPPYHAAGLAHLLFFIPANTTVICPTSSGVPTAAALVAASKETPIDVAMVSPVMLQELAQNPELLEQGSQSIRHLIYSGGDLPNQLGNTVASKFNLANQFGATEVGMLNSIQCKARRDAQKDWQYTQFNPAMAAVTMGSELRRVTEKEHELVIVRSPEREAHQLPFAIFPDLQEYRTRDLWVRHPDPDKADFWKWSARLDDVIVFLNGEKTNPISMEQAIVAANPEVSVALVAGAQRFQASLLIELVEPKQLNPSERAAFIERIWPSIQEANTVCPAHARIAKTHVLFTRPEKPLPRSAKCIVQRSAALSLYAEELDALYADADRLSPPDGELVGPGCVRDPQAVSDFIHKCVSNITGWEENIDMSENWFHLGMDSLQAMTTARQLQRGFQMPDITQNLIYLHPSISDLTQAIILLMDNQTSHETTHNQLQERDSLLQYFQAQLSSNQPPKPLPTTPTFKITPQKHTVILTGSTGTLGTHLLHVLQSHPSVSHIHCLNRKPTTPHPKSKPKPTHPTTFWTTDLTHPTLGLTHTNYQTLQTTTTLIIHNAWPVNFNLSLESFTPQLIGITNLINFASSSGSRSRTHTPPHIFFISSTSSIPPSSQPCTPIPEKIIHTQKPGKTGYATSKYITEHLLHHASKTHRLGVSIARVGQIAAPIHSPGVWNRSEWFPSLVRSSVEVGAVPEGIGELGGEAVDWVPVDEVAGVLGELALGGRTGVGEGNGDGDGVEVFHVVNLNPVNWGLVRDVVREVLAEYKGEGEGVNVVEFGEWVGRVRGVVERAEGMGAGDEEMRDVVEKNPAGKLLGFFEGAVEGGRGAEGGRVFETRRTAERSARLRAVEGVKAEWVRKWVREILG
ncbi:acetyl-CoA synthetase-like protein [Aspergillus sclerotiicarbonarius CBS 121057]|uniref:Acetyl-CoA synthetase-like protein n=1 Tax=Aspergillus sclerotiicarbonarius (strain CBS 121057 / IBT 28362) TaxID=1448318 RepID=A0A319EQW0_ASPSB|nr:acetyl-CoA synthetase-like protein [Aspergillus sclerotiicarbonarius CBS 121057]